MLFAPDLLAEPADGQNSVVPRTIPRGHGMRPAVPLEEIAMAGRQFRAGWNGVAAFATRIVRIARAEQPTATAVDPKEHPQPGRTTRPIRHAVLTDVRLETFAKHPSAQLSLLRHVDDL